MNPVMIMLDTETTHLDARAGKAWEVGMVVFDSNYNSLASHTALAPIHRQVFDQDTYNWLVDQHGQAFMASVVSTEDYDTLFLGGISQYAGAMQSCLDFINQQIDTYGQKNVHLICNHPYFDIPIMWNSLDCAGIKTDQNLGFYYRNIHDLQDLCRGTARGNFSKMYKDFKFLQEQKGRGTVTHRALDDCYGQIQMLEFFEVRL